MQLFAKAKELAGGRNFILCAIAGGDEDIVCQDFLDRYVFQVPSSDAMTLLAAHAAPFGAVMRIFPACYAALAYHRSILPVCACLVGGTCACGAEGYCVPCGERRVRRVFGHPLFEGLRPPFSQPWIATCGANQAIFAWVAACCANQAMLLFVAVAHVLVYSLQTSTALVEYNCEVGLRDARV